MGSFYFYVTLVFYYAVLHGCQPEPEEAYTSLSEYHDYEPSLEFDDSELIQNPGLGKWKNYMQHYSCYLSLNIGEGLIILVC